MDGCLIKINICSIRIDDYFNGIYIHSILEFLSLGAVGIYTILAMLLNRASQ